MPEDIAAKIDAALSRYPKRSYPKGQILVFADETPEHIFYITEGRVRQYDISYRGDEIVLNTFKPPAFFAVPWCLGGLPNKYFFKTETDVEAHVVPLADARTFLQDNPDVVLDLLTRVYRGMEGILGRLTHLMSGTARSRLVYELLVDCRRFGHAAPDGAITLESNETDLAAQSGLSRETVSREIAKLKEYGWLRIDGKTIIVTDVASLEHALGQEI